MKTARWLSGFAALMLALPALASTTTTADAVATIERNARAAHSDAVLVWKDGKALLEPQPETGEEPVHLMSATKSVVALAVMLLLDDGKLASVDEPVSNIFAEWKQGRKRDITVRMLLDHTSGLQNMANAGEELEAAPDLVKLALAAELSSDPGTTFSYNNKATNLLPGIVERLAGEPMDAYLEKRLFKPLGIARYTWLKDGAGTPLGMAGLSLSARDLAKIGQLLLDGGVTPAGTRVLSERSVALLTGASARSPDVGLLWWRIPAWERYELKGQMAGFLAQHGVSAPVQQALLATGGRVFDSKSALIAYVAERLGADWPGRTAVGSGAFPLWQSIATRSQQKPKLDGYAISHNVYYVTKRSTHTNPNQSSPGRTLLPFKQPSQRPQNLAPRRQLLTQHAGPPV